jgi:hypothetical protein
MPFYATSSVTAPQLQSATPAAGFTFVNATPVILSWTAPSDGKLHRYTIYVGQTVSSNMTGGETAILFTTPGGTPESQQFGAAGLAAGFYGPNSFAFLSGMVEAGTTVTIEQFTAMTAGAAVMWAELWAS